MTLPRIARVECDGFDYSIFATGDYISQHVFLTGSWEPTVHAAAAMLLKGFDQPVVIDAGANIGLFSVPVANQIGPAGGKLYAFEAQRVVFQQLCANLFANRIDCAFAYHQAVGAADGKLALPTFDYAKVTNVGAFSVDESLQRRRGLEAGIDRSRTETIDMVALDSVAVEGRVRLIKIDVEGTEVDVIRGAHRLIEHNRFPPILFEAWEDPHFVAERSVLDGEIKSLGYRISRLGRDSFLAQHPGNEAELTVMADGGQVSLSRSR